MGASRIRVAVSPEVGCIVEGATCLVLGPSSFDIDVARCCPLARVTEGPILTGFFVGKMGRELEVR